MRVDVDNNQPLNRMLTVAEVAYALHVHPTTVRKWEKLGQLKSYRLGARGNVRFKAEDISLFADSPGTTPVPVRPSPPRPGHRTPHPVPVKEMEGKTGEQVEPRITPASVDLSETVKKALRESEEKFTRIFAHSPVALSLTRLRDNVVIEINESYTRFTGHTREEIIGRKVSEINIWVNPADRERMLRIMREEGRVSNEEFSFREKSGEVHPVIFSAENISIAGEDCLLVMTIDISKRKRAEESLQESEEKFRNLFEHAKDAVVLADADTGLLVDINPAGCAMLGRPKDQIVGRHMTLLHPPEMADKFKQIFHEHVEKGLVDSDDTIIQRADGSRMPASVSASVTKIGDKTLIQGVFRDVSGRKRADEALKDSEEKFSKAFNVSANAICITSLPDNKFIEVNESYYRFTGYSREEVIGHTAAELKLWVNEEELKQLQIKLREEGKFHNLEFHSRMKSGEIRIGLSSAEVINIGGKPCRMVVITDITERKRAEEALKDSEEKFSRAFSSSGNAICITSMPDNKYVEINESYTRFTGYTREEVIGHGTAELNLWVQDEELKRFLGMLEEKGKFNNMEFHSRMKSGEIRIGLASAEVINIGGKPCRMVVITDITERKKAEEALKDSEEKFSKAFDFSAAAICITSLKDNRFVEANESFTRFTGYPREEIIGRNAAELKLWVKQEELKQWMDKLKAEGRVSNQEFSSRMKSGEIRIGLSSAEVINIGNEPCRIVVITDITGRKKAEESLRFSDAAFKSIHESVIALDNDNNITYWNDISEQLFGIKASEALGKKLRSIIQPVELHPGQNDELIKKLTEKGYNRDELLYTTPNGKVWVDMTVRAIEKDGNHYGHVMTASDITERKRMEQELLAYRTHLEELVQKRTSELSTVNQKLEEELEERKRIGRELVQARDAAEIANRAKSDFLAHMSHEIRTPIHGVMGTLNLLLDTELKEEQRQYGSMARASAESLLGIINDILDFSKIEAGQLVLEEMDFDLQATVEEALQPMSLAAYKKGLELTCRVSPGVPAVLVGDAGRLRQTLVNLLGNGVKFTERGEVSASIAIESDSNDSVELHFTVRDTGIGIPPDKQGLLFSPFIQGNGSKYGGTGLGLVICRQLVKMMQGRIWLESQPGQGSAFHFTARFKKSASAAPSASVPPALENFKGTPALVVDDNATTRLILTEILNSWGLVATAAESGEAALQQLQKIKDNSNRLPVILLDMTMPASNGLAIARQMGDDPLLKRHIIMMLPCDNISDDFVRCQEAGIATHLVKPIKKHELQDAILAVLSASNDEKKEPVKPAPSATPQLKLRILVAEDNPTSQLIARKTLEKMGCTIQIAGNGVEATRMAQQDGIDLVLMDFQMPEMDGLEATRIIREREKETRRHLPIIAMTANAMKQDHDKCLAAGMDGYLTKPVSPDNLYNAIKGLLPPPKPDREPAVDLETAMRTVGGDIDILKEVLQVFLGEDSPRLLQSIKDGIQRQDGKIIKAEAHGMKGAAAALGGKTVAATAARLEAAALNGDMTAAQTVFDEMCAELERFKDFYSRAELEIKGGVR